MLTALAATAGAQVEGTSYSWIGQPGINESVGAIMARKGDTGSVSHFVRAMKPHLLRNQPGLPANPASALAGQWPPPRGRHMAQSMPFTASPLAAQTVASNFLGAQLSDTIGYVPPDSMAEVGTNQIIVCVNGRIRSFGKNGVADGHLDTTTDNFFLSVLGGSSTSDPRVRYDRLSSRWFITMITVTTPTNAVLLAVSSGPTVTSTSSFTFYSFQADSADFGDYDTLGVDANAVYIGLNLFSGNNLANTKGFVVNKAKLLQGMLSVTAFPNLIVTSGHPPRTHGPFTPQGVNNDDPAATEGYFIGVDAGVFGTLTLRRISNPGGTPTISGNILVTVPTTAYPMGGVPALGSSLALDDLDDRLFATRMHKGSLWTAHNIQVDTNGVASSAGGRDGARWYQLTNMTSTPVLAQSGTLYDPSASNPRSFWIPSCAMSGQGHMALGSSVAGAAEHAEIAVAGRLATDPAGTQQAPITAVTSTSTYNIGVENGVYRWGDFSVTSVDPSDDMTIWTVQEYCNTNDSWGVAVVKLLAPPPALPVNCTPASLAPGSTNVNVTVTASSASGSGFFDPGSGFPNHIGASVNGLGVTVNSVTYNNPTNLTLNLSIGTNAAGGGRIITVVNPDGQSVRSSSGILTVLGPTNHPPVLAPIPGQALAVGMTLTFTNVGSDPDGDQLTYSLLGGSPTNATLNASTGVFSWTPVPSQIGTNQVGVVIADSGVPSLTATQIFSVTVFPSNSPPTLTPVPDHTLAAGMTLIFTNSAFDTDGDELTFGLMAGAPANATLDSLTGVFSWTPNSSQVGTNTVGIVVTDDGFPVLSATQTFLVTVVASNRPPSLSPVSNRSIYAGIGLVLTNSASDPDPGQTLTFSLDPGAPAGAFIDPATGVFSWTPGVDQMGTNTIVIRVSDNGLPPLSATQAFVADVVSAPVLAITTSNGTPWLSWPSLAGATYQLQFETNLSDSIWVPLLPNITATDTNAQVSDSLGTNAVRFYRLWLVP